MDLVIGAIIKPYVDSMVQFVLDKNPQVDKVKMHQKLVELGFYNLSFDPSPSKSQRTITKTSKKNSVLTVCRQQQATLKVKRSRFDNFVLSLDDPLYDDLTKSNFVLELGSKIVVGYEDFDGVVVPLTKDLLEICDKYKLRYKIPLNLNHGESVVEQDQNFADEIRKLNLLDAASCTEEECSEEEND
jgi:hypothetical protein